MTLPILTALPIHSRCFFAITLSEGKSCPFLIENPSSFGDVAPLVVGRQKGGFSPTSPRPCEGSSIYIRKYVVSHRRTRQTTYSTYRQTCGIPLFQYLLLLNLGLDPLILREIPSCIGSRVRTFFGFRLNCLRCWGISVHVSASLSFGQWRSPGSVSLSCPPREKRGERRVLPRRRANSGERERVSVFPLEMLGGCLLMCFLVCEVRRKDSNINNGKKARGTISLPPDTPFRNRNLEANQ